MRRVARHCVLEGDIVTATKHVRVTCDDTHLGACEKCWIGDPNQTIFSTRTDAHKAGWRYRGGRDWCPDHAGDTKKAP